MSSTSWPTKHPFCMTLKTKLIHSRQWLESCLQIFYVFIRLYSNAYPCSISLVVLNRTGKMEKKKIQFNQIIILDHINTYSKKSVKQLKYQQSNNIKMVWQKEGGIRKGEFYIFERHKVVESRGRKHTPTHWVTAQMLTWPQAKGWNTWMSQELIQSPTLVAGTDSPEPPL